jgi:hypothetical protein
MIGQKITNLNLMQFLFFSRAFARQIRLGGNFTVLALKHKFQILNHSVD